MAARRLSQAQKREILDSFRAGGTASSLSEEYGCSPNTITRTLKALLPQDEYIQLKAARGRSVARKDNLKGFDSIKPSGQNECKASAKDENLVDSSRLSFSEEDSLNLLGLNEKIQRPLALDDAEDFNYEQDDESLDNEEVALANIDNKNLEEKNNEIRKTSSEPLLLDALPETVYMLVDKIVELDVKPLKDFPELISIQNIDQDRKAIQLFSSQRSAKRNCGRSQRVIKIPDSKIFKISNSFLLARGITRLVVDDKLITLELTT